MSLKEPIAKDIKFYFDKECTRPLKKVEWDGGFYIEFMDGRKELVKNTALAGQEATATFYARNESSHKFGVQGISHPDKDVKVAIDYHWLLPMSPVKVTFSVKIPSEPTQKDVVESANFIIWGYFIID